MIRRIAVLFGLALLPAGAPEVDRPSFLVILVDDMGWSDLGCYGSEIKTPHLDALAAGGLKYTQMYNTAKCYPTRAALLTGLYFQRTDREFPGTKTAGEVLRPAGYATWWSGKHHARFNPHGRGFDHFFGFLGGATSFWKPGLAWADDAEIIKPLKPPEGWYATDAFTDKALGWLEEAGDRPFFLYVAYNAPHWPLHAWPEDIAKYEGVYDAGYDAIRRARWKRQVETGLFAADTARLSEPEYGSDWEKLPAEEKKRESKRMEIHAAMVYRVDQNIGRLVAKLREKGRLDNTLILFLSDNGASHERPKKDHDPKAPWGGPGSFESIGRSWATVSNTPMRRWKTSSHEGGINTPMVAHWPKGIRDPGRIVREPVHLVDLLPTFVDLGNATYPDEGVPPMDGISIAPTFEGRPLDRKKLLFWEFGGGNAVRDGKWKLVRSGGKAWELYDLEADRTETNNLASEHPDRVTAMGDAWEAWYRECTGKPYAGKKKRKK